MLSIVEIVNSSHQVGIVALLVVNSCILGLILGNDSIYLLDLQSKDENVNVSRSFFWSVFFRIQSKYGKIRTRKNYVFGYFSHSVPYHRKLTF